MKHYHIWSWVRNALGIGVIVFMLAALVVGVKEMYSYDRPIDWWLLIPALLLTLLASLLGGFAWDFLLRSLGYRGAWQQSLVTHILSTTTKYLPGYGWHYVSKGILVREHLRYPRQIGLVIVAELGIVLAIGVLIALAFMLRFGIQLGEFVWPAWVLILGFIATCTGLALSIGFVVRQVKISTAEFRGIRNRFSTIFWLASMLGAVSAGWMCLGLSAWLVLQALGFIADPSLPAIFVALILSSIMSLLVVFVPAGMGVREVTFAALLSPPLIFSIGITVGVILRILSIVSEIIELGVVILLIKHWPASAKMHFSSERYGDNTPNGVLSNGQIEGILIKRDSED